VLGTDIIVMEETAKFALPEIQCRRASPMPHVKLPAANPLSHRGGIPAHGTLDGRRRGKHWGLANHVVPRARA